MVRPELPVQRHLALPDHQDMQMRGAFHGVEKVEQAMLVAPRGWGEDWTLYERRVLERHSRAVKELQQIPHGHLSFKTATVAARRKRYLGGDQRQAHAF